MYFNVGNVFIYILVRSAQQPGRINSAMSFGYGESDIMAVSKLALKVIAAPGDYRNISDEV